LGGVRTASSPPRQARMWVRRHGAERLVEVRRPGGRSRASQAGHAFALKECRARVFWFCFWGGRARDAVWGPEVDAIKPTRDGIDGKRQLIWGIAARQAARGECEPKKRTAMRDPK